MKSKYIQKGKPSDGWCVCLIVLMECHVLAFATTVLLLLLLFNIMASKFMNAHVCTTIYDYTNKTSPMPMCALIRDTRIIIISLQHVVGQFPQQSVFYQIQGDFELSDCTSPHKLYISRPSTHSGQF